MKELEGNNFKCKKMKILMAKNPKNNRKALNFKLNKGRFAMAKLNQ